MSADRWTWDEQTHPDVAGVLGTPVCDLDWCDRLETAATDPIAGKVLCVCAASAIARVVIAADGGTRATKDALELLDRWIDDPTEERFDMICSLIFGEGELPDLGAHGTGWWALRTATSSVGNYEGGWALASTCHAAVRAGFSPEDLRNIAARAVMDRRKRD